MSFRFSGLTEEFFEKIVLFDFWRPSPHMDTAGGVLMVAEDGTVYLIDATYDGTGFELPYRDYAKVFTFLQDDGPYHDCKAPKNNQWRFLGSHVVRSDFYDALKERFEALREKDEYLSMPKVAVELLGFDYKQARENEVVYEKSLEARARHRREEEEWAAHREKVRLREEDVEWEEVLSLNKSIGYRLALAMQDSNGGLIADLDYIEVQRAYDLGEFGMSQNSPVEAYNLFHNRWYTVVEPIELGEGMHAWEDKGHFVRSFARLEDAKAFALSRSAVNKENRVDAGKVFATRTRKLVLTPDEQAERYLHEAERLTRRFAECYFDSKRYLLRTDKLIEKLSDENRERLAQAWQRFDEGVDRVKRGEDPLDV